MLEETLIIMDQLNTIQEMLTTVIRKDNNLQSQLDAIAAALNTLTINLTADDSAIQTAIAALQAANPALDLTGVNAALAGIATQVGLTAALIPATPPAPTS